jgi:hypothetical protein
LTEKWIYAILTICICKGGQMDKMETLWEKVKHGFIIAAEKTDELTKIGKLKLDIIATHRKIRQNFEELGGRAYELLKTGRSKKPVRGDKEISQIIRKIKDLEKDLAKQEKEIKKLTKNL